MLKFHAITENVMHPGGSFSEKDKHDLPTFISRDDRDRLHNAHGPAVEYYDGRKLYYWHGKPVTGPAHLGSIRVGAIKI